MCKDLDKLKNQLHSFGLVVIKNFFEYNLVKKLRMELDKAFQEDLNNEQYVFDKGMVHNCMFRGEEMGKLLNHQKMNKYIKELFCPHAIIYAYQSSSLPPHAGNYGSRVHVDSPRFIKNYITNMGIIIPLDDFTKNNGGTYFLPASHLTEDIPSDTYFYSNCQQLECEQGDLIFFNARLVHAAGINHTNITRHALTINLCRSFMRQRFDYCRMASQRYIDSLNNDGKRLLGWNVRVPVTLDEFYLPLDKRLYLPDQG